jgi:hypothetical protein
VRTLLTTYGSAPKVYTRMALIFPVTDYDSAMEKLQVALDRTCTQLPYLKGYVVEEDRSQRMQSSIIFDTAGPSPRFVKILAPVNLPRYADLNEDRTPFPPDIFPSPMTPGKAEAPVLAASYTKIDGGLVICIATYHKVIDGTGYSEVLKLLAANSLGDATETIASGAGPDPNEIASRRYRILKGNVEVSHEFKGLDLEAALARHPEYMLKSKINLDAAHRVPGSFALSGQNTNRVFPFSYEKIDIVRKALTGTLPLSTLTVNNILTAIVWPFITYIRATRDKDQMTSDVSKIDFPVSGRRLVGPHLQSPPYLGNAISYGQTKAPVSELSFLPSLQELEKLVPVLRLISSATADLTEKTMESLVHLSDKNPDLSNITMSWLLNGPGDVHFISWAQVSVYELDFGEILGYPAFMRSALMKLDGVVTFLPRRRVRDCNESLDVSVLLREDDMISLSDNKAWRSWVSGASN